MGAGTAITFVGLALLAIKALDTASSLMNKKLGNWVMISTDIALLDGVFILAFGIVLLSLSFGYAHPLRPYSGSREVAVILIYTL